MVIACLGWGSLIWKPGDLPLRCEWFFDGPRLPVEFCRVGDGGELATALCMNATPSQVLWSVLDVPDLDTACQALRVREQIPEQRDDGVGLYVPARNDQGVLADWALERGVDALVWTALPPRIDNQEGRLPSRRQAIDYLQGLQGETREHARDYLARVPEQIATPWRREVMRALDLNSGA